MNPTSVLLMIGALLAPGVLDAATEAAREFDRLTQERDKALATAAEPIQRRYKAALEPLLKKAMTGNDLETALRIKQALEAVNTKLPEPALRAKSEFVGRWDIKNETDGHQATLELNADGTFGKPGGDGAFGATGKRIGAWEVKGKQLILVYDNRGGHSDKFELPVRAGRLEGRNTIGHVMILTRKLE